MTLVWHTSFVKCTRGSSITCRYHLDSRTLAKSAILGHNLVKLFILGPTSSHRHLVLTWHDQISSLSSFIFLSLHLFLHVAFYRICWWRRHKALHLLHQLFFLRVHRRHRWHFIVPIKSISPQSWQCQR